MARELFNETTPLRQEVESQGLEALKTGGINAQIPIINRMIENSKSALSRGLNDTEQRLGASGLAKSPWGNSVMASQRIAGQQNIANIGPQTAMQFVSQIPSFISGQTQVSVGGMGQATQAASTRAASEDDAYAKILGAMMGSVSNVGAAAYNG